MLYFICPILWPPALRFSAHYLTYPNPNNFFNLPLYRSSLHSWNPMVHHFNQHTVHMCPLSPGWTSYVKSQLWLNAPFCLLCLWICSTKHGQSETTLHVLVLLYHHDHEFQGACQHCLPLIRCYSGHLLFLSLSFY